MDILNKNMKYSEEANGNPGSSTFDFDEDIAEVLKNNRVNCNSEDLDDDDDPFTAPFEILAEFLSALMARDYKNALQYCEQILQYEPNNTTVLEFHPLIEEKIRSAQSETHISSEESADSSDNSRESTDGSTEYYSSVSSAYSSASNATTSCSDEEDADGEEKECETCVVNADVSYGISSVSSAFPCKK